jgi:polyisoprenoid-binding protein YceI
VTRKKWLIAGAVAVVVVVVGGFIAIKLVEGGSKKVLTLPTVTTLPGSSATSSGPVDVDGTWKVSSGSTAGYRVQETLFGVSNIAVGRTSAVTGSIAISGTTVSTGSFSVDLTQVTSDRSERDDQFQTRIMDTAMYPTATFALTKSIDFTTLPANGVKVTESATGNLTMHGVTKSETFSITAQRNGAIIQVLGSIPITFSDWNIANPSGGPATTGNTGTLEFQLNFSQT